MAASSVAQQWASAVLRVLGAQGHGLPSDPAPGGAPPVTAPPGSSGSQPTDGSGSQPSDGGFAAALLYGLSGQPFRSQLAQHVPGPDDQANLALGIGVRNTGQTDAFGNVYAPVDNSVWQGGAIPLAGHPEHPSGQNAQLWGGPSSDSAPDWLRKIVAGALAMPPGPERDARIRHIMSSVMSDPSASTHDIMFVNRAFGFSPASGRPD